MLFRVTNAKGATMGQQRQTDLARVLFPVEKRPIYVFDGRTYREEKRFHAIVDVEKNHTFAVVSKDYHLVTNREAFELGRLFFRHVFSAATADDMEIFNIIQPATRSFCHIDFLHKARALVIQKGDTWFPYLRVTNSYNRTKPLCFDIGFCRAICTNGMIFGKQNVVLRYYHTREHITLSPILEVEANRLKKMEADFIGHMHRLREVDIPKENMFALACKAFGITITAEDLCKPQRRQRLLGLRDEIHRLADKYFAEMGGNGYAAINVLTDFATRPGAYTPQKSMIHSLQKRCGDWLVGFLEAVNTRPFNLQEYLGGSLEAANILA
ncbi:MAG: DUF932 domain-containing protein [Planctomycetota bacterium]|nr:MAG: DUF932 domain-containing protein [Planctomycetota bacterium]